jgi:hypothetical protein
MLLKVLPKPPRPIEIFIPKSKKKRDNIHNNVVNNVNDGIKARETFVGLMLYGITWLLMPLKVLHNPPRPTRISCLNQRGKGNNNHNLVNKEQD